MRMFWVAMVLLAIVVAFTAGIYYLTASVHNDLLGSIKLVEQAVGAGDWEWAEQETRRLARFWDRACSLWTPVMDHKDIDRADEVIARVIRLVDLQYRDELLLEIAIARRLINRLKEKETPRLGNIF